jgi:predicted dehydrogenase
MKILQVGLGSMGKRRIRNLMSLGLKDIVGFDFREDRRQEAQEKYSVKVVDKIDDGILSDIDILIISTPPDRHLEYMRMAVSHKKSAFVEASVIKAGLAELAEEARENQVLIAPSCSFRFHPSIKTIRELVTGGAYGKVCNFIYHMGQYLPDWHPWEDIKDFYVSDRNTGACREMVPFELTWMVEVFGFPQEVFAFCGKTLDLGVDIDDTYSINLKFDHCFGNILVDVVARYANRDLIVNLETGSIFWNWNEKIVKLYDANLDRWIHYHEPLGKAHEGYNPNIIEEMYIKEMNAFIRAFQGEDKFPNTLKEDIRILEILEVLEKSNHGTKIMG